VVLYAIFRKEAITLTGQFNKNGVMDVTFSGNISGNVSCTLPAVYNNAVQDT
jgi:hypothetical protein